jgi:hypothetical protein
MLAAGEWDLLPHAGLSPVTPEAPWLRGLSKGEAPAGLAWFETALRASSP